MSRERPRVVGSIMEDGKVLCTCGKRAGGVEEGAVTFACGCGNLVVLQHDIYRMHILSQAIAALNRNSELLGRVVESLATSTPLQ